MQVLGELGRVALRFRSAEYRPTNVALLQRVEAAYGKSSPRESDLAHAELHCAGCLMEFPWSYRLSLGGHGTAGVVWGATPGFREFGQTGRCPQCGSESSLLVYESFNGWDVTEDDVDRIRRYWRMRARDAWKQLPGQVGCCDDCNGDIPRDEGYLDGSNLICASCAAQKLAGAVEKLRRDPHYFGSALLRKIRAPR